MSLKITPHEVNEDLCKTSIDILMEKCTDWFRRKEIMGPLWFADSAQPFPYGNEQTVNIVLFGGFLRRFLESGNWDLSNARLWVLSHSVKDILSQLLGIDANHIGVIPRYELFPLAPSALPFPQWNETTTFVFAGRISNVKNIKMLLETVSELQTQHNLPVQLALIGSYDNQTHSDRGRYENSNYQFDIESLIKKLPWQTRPCITPKVDPTQWPQMKFVNPVYVNFSTFICEDFDVSTAQVQALGWPCLLSDWGGHRDVVGKNVFKIAPSQIAHDHEPNQVRRIKAKALAKHLRHSLPQDLPVHAEQISTVSTSISQGHLDICRRAFLKKYQDGVSLAYREDLAHFADTPAGKKFFASYRALFSGSTEQEPSQCVLINDLHSSCDPGLADVFSTCCEIIESSTEPIKFISLRDLFAADSLKAIMTCDIFTIPFFAEEVRPTIEHLLKYLHPRKIVLHTRQDQVVLYEHSYS